MKHLKKIMSLLLTVIMVIAMCVPVMADGGYTLTINQENQRHTYEAYQIFKGDLSGNTLSNVEWGQGVNSTKTVEEKTLLDALKEKNTKFSACNTAADVAKVLGTQDANGSLTFTTEELDVFAAVVSKYLNTATGTSSYVEAAKNYTIANLDAGYYFVKDKDGSLNTEGADAYTKFIIKLVKNTDVTPKTDTPKAEKKVKENVKQVTDDANYGKGYNDVADYNIGDTVPFAFYSVVPDMANYKSYNYVFEDKMDAGLTFDEKSVVVKIGNKPIASSKYTITKNPDDKCTFHVEIADLKSLTAEEEIAAGSEIRIDFNATLNANAVIGLPGNVNQMKLKYSNNPNDNSSKGETPWDKVIVFTYELDTTKIEKDNTTNKLEGAEFILYRGENSKEYAIVSKGKLTGWIPNKESATVLKSDKDGKFVVKGLDDGTYFLEETKAPEGYNLLKDPVKIQINAETANNQNWNGDAKKALTSLKIKVNNDNGVESTDTNKGIVSATVENSKGSQLPETGGIGTTIFYVVGVVLMLGAGVLLITKRRMSAKH